MGIFSFESFALFVFVVALGAGMAWRQMRWAAKPVEDTRDQREEGEKSSADKQAARDEELIAADLYNEACSMEPFCGAQEKVISVADFLAQAEADRQARSRRAVRRAQEAARASVTRQP